MSAAPSEPEKYSIDDMMDRLKSPPSEDPEAGELVTRADGSQAIRVRKRKRRSTQPHKDAVHRTRRSRILQVSAALIVVFITALSIGAAVIYANSSPFRQNLQRHIEQASGATVEFQQFRMNPKTANAGVISLKWPDGNVLQSLTLTGITAEIFPSSFLGKSMNGEEVTVGEGVLSLQIPKPGGILTNHAMSGEPSSIRFNRYRIPRFQLALGDPRAPSISLLKSEASLSPYNVSGRPLMSLYRGNLSVAGWPALRLDRALLEFRGSEVDVIGLRILAPQDDRGSFELSGTVSPYKPDQLSTLAVNLDSFQLAGLTGPALGRLVSGRIDTLPVAKSNYLSFKPSDSPDPTLDITYHAAPTSQIEVKGFPFLFALYQLLDDTWFERPVFESETSGVFHRENGVVTLRNLQLENKDRMALKGEISIAADQTLSGTLDVGLAEGMILAANTPRLKSMFGPSKDGFRWVTLKISGPASAPSDNFKELFSTATATPAAPAEIPRSSFEDLTRPK